MIAKQRQLDAIRWSSASFMVLAFAKSLALLGAWPSLWALPAYFWQDALIAIVIGLVAAIGQRWISIPLYALLCIYAAINVPIARLMSTPLTIPMLRAARGALSDSVAHELTADAILMSSAVIVVGTISCFLMRRCSQVLLRTIVAVQILLLLIGPVSSDRFNTEGRHRNAVLTLVTTALPRISSAAQPQATADWRRGFDQPSSTDNLNHLRGQAAGRNVVLILLESHGARYLGLGGHSPDPTPHLSSLARLGLLFDHAYTVYPESIKSLAATLSSRYPAIDTRPESYERNLPPSIASILSQHGYATALFHSGRFAYLGMESMVRNRGFQVLEDAGDISGQHQSSFGVDEPSTVARALQWIDSLPRTQPFFLTYLPIAGHHPYATPQAGPFGGDDDQSRYLNSLHYGDASLGALIQGLQSRGRFERTLFVLFGDHGEAFGQHEGNFGHTSFVYEENIHVPYVIAIPGLLQGQTRIDRLASTIDTGPTILDLLGIAPPTQWQGSSLLEPVNHAALFCTDYAEALLGLRDGTWKFIQSIDSGHSRLYDLASDPAETKDRSSSEPARVDYYKTRLMLWAEAQRSQVLSSQPDSHLPLITARSASTD